MSTDSSSDDKLTDIQKLVKDRIQKEADILAEDEKKKSVAVDSSDKITSRFVIDCLYANELGDGMLFAALHKDKYLYNKSSGAWLMWAGHYWQEDIMNNSLSAVETVALRYLDEAKNMVETIGEASKSGDKDKITELQKAQNTIYKRVSKLRSDRGRSNCLKFAHTNPVNPMSVKGDEFDTNQYLFACKNGIIELRTGKLRPGRPDDYISRASPVNYTGIDTQAPNWEKALKEIFEDRQPLIDFMRRLLSSKSYLT